MPPFSYWITLPSALFVLTTIAGLFGAYRAGIISERWYDWLPFIVTLILFVPSYWVVASDQFRNSDRHFSKKAKIEIAKVAEKFTGAIHDVQVTAGGGSEARAFTQELIEILQKARWGGTADLDSAVYSNSSEDFVFYAKPDGIEAATALEKTLIQAGYKVYFVPNENPTSDEMPEHQLGITVNRKDHS